MSKKSVPPSDLYDSYYAAHVDKPTSMMAPTKQAPSAPYAGDVHVSAQQPIKHYADDNAHAVAVPIIAPELLPPSPMVKRSLLWLTLKLIPYHLLNFVLGTTAFCVVVTGVSLSVGLLPLCGLGIIVYLVLLQAVRLLVIMDVALANTITRTQAGVHWNVPDNAEETNSISSQLRLAPKLARCSIRSTIVILYFATVKFVLGIISCVVVFLPFLPIAAQIVADHTSEMTESYTAGFPVHKFNFGTDPFLYVLACIGYFVIGVVLMHFFGRVSRQTTRWVCCKEIAPMQNPISGVV